ncbi:hypothetical protein [Neisseria shayeganii]|uniref:hypothetical protein n=1 Tax=Neisseria shayeganii TaxID=607712 RepID=UPI0012EAEFAE|nr:hypothetical protein [Neisseria shayeganii]
MKVKKVKEVLEEFKKNRRLPKQKIQKLSFISAVILILLILMPSLKLDKFTEHTLQRMKLGGFDVTVRTDDKRVLEGFLLLKTKEFYYVYPMCNGKKFAENVVIINTQNTTLIYKAESKNSEIKQEIQESTQKSSGADSINLETK